MTNANNIVLYHHPFSRAANTVWMLEELGVPYTLEYVDMGQGAQHADGFHQKNRMGKLPTLVDGDVTVTESAAIGLYLADRYSYGDLAPKIDAPERATYLRWILFAPSVIEPGCYAEMSKWDYKPGSAGWGTYENMLATVETAIGEGPWLLGERFTMADVVFGGTVRYMLRFGMIEKRPSFVAYAERLDARPASIAAAAKNAAIVQERKLGG
ncbi:MAG: glutathione S-transferase family protein [Polyangiales bacterium]